MRSPPGTFTRSPLARSPLSSSLFRRFRRPFDRRERFEIDRDRGVFVRRQLRAIAHDLGHTAANGIAVGRHASLEHVDDVFLRPVADALLGDVGYPTLPVRIGTAR